jgi:RNA polymerase sigma factor (TIGR02999 family)
MSGKQEITELLRNWSGGDEAALEKLTALLYGELHRMAHRYMRQERPGHTLQTTALINEVYLRLIAWKDVSWHNRAQFFGVSAQLMRKILVDFARSRSYAKRGAGARPISLNVDVRKSRAVRLKISSRSIRHYDSWPISTHVKVKSSNYDSLAD